MKQFNSLLPVLAYSFLRGEKTISIKTKDLNFVVLVLKEHINYQYKLLTNISGIDYLKTKYRFSVAYELLSLVFVSRLRLKVFVNELSPVYSITSIFKNANWWEREI